MRRKVVETLLILLCLAPTAQAQITRGPGAASSGIITAVTPTSSAGTIAANGQTVTVGLGGWGAVAIQATGTWVGTMAFEGSVDGTNYVGLDAVPFGGTTGVANFTVNGAWSVTAAGLQSLRVRATAWTSGSASITLRATLSGGASAGGGGGSGGTVAISQTATENDVDIATTVFPSDATTGNGVTGVKVQRVNEATDSDLTLATSNIQTNTAASANALNDLVSNLAEDATHANAVTATGPQIMFEAKNWDGLALPNAVTEGQAIRPAATLTGVSYAFLSDATGGATIANVVSNATSGADWGIPSLTRRIDTLAPASNASGDFDNANVNASGALWVAPTAATNGGCTPGKLISAATTNATVIKASAGQLYSLQVINLNAATRYLKFYDKASAPTVGTDTPVQTLPIPPNGTTGGGFVLPIPVGMAFSNGIAFALTTGIADSDTGAVAANEIVVNYCSK